MPCEWTPTFGKATGAIAVIMRAFLRTVADENKGVKRPEDDGAFFEPTIPKRA